MSISTPVADDGSIAVSRLCRAVGDTCHTSAMVGCGQ